MKKKTTVWIQHCHYIKLFPFWTFHNSVYPLIVQNCFKPGGSNHVNPSLKAFTRIWHINDCLKVARFEHIDVPLWSFKWESPRHVPVEVLIWIVWPINACLLSWAQTQCRHKHVCSWICSWTVRKRLFPKIWEMFCFFWAIIIIICGSEAKQNTSLQHNHK